MSETIFYVHGKGGSAEESEHYRKLFPGCGIFGLDYRTFTPWETGIEIREAAESLRERCTGITLIANSIGAFFSMHAGIEQVIRRAFFISPILDMERLILDMMEWAGVTERELQERRVIHTGFGEDLSWEYLCYVREHPVRWNVPTRILYGGRDSLTRFETAAAFAQAHGADLTVMENGEHWFHTEEQMRFLDRWISQTA